MHPKYIENFETEAETIRALSTGGFVIVFDITAFGPAYVHNEFSEEWRRLYEKKSYHARDAVFLRANIGDCKMRWSEVDFRIPFITTKKVEIHAAEFGLKYGAIISKKRKHRSFISCARADKEFTDGEIDLIEMKFNRILDGAENANVLSPEKLRILKMLAEGCNQKQISSDLNIPYPTLRLRLKEINKELNVKTPAEAAVKAIELRLFR